MGGVVWTARHQAGLSARELARRSGISHSRILDIENGHVEPTLPTVQRILRGVGMELRLHLAPYDDHDEVLRQMYDRLDESEQTKVDERHARNLAMFRSAKAIK
jgi:transcriptional regulator with XRE-family HTH domain